MQKELSSLFVEVHEKFLPEPLVLTILMESKSTPCHLCIERDGTKGQKHPPSEAISKILFAGRQRKGYLWMVQFLEVMHKISFTRNKELSKELVMTQYMLKLLTILSNILVSNMQMIDAARTEKYVHTLVSALKVSL